MNARQFVSQFEQLFRRGRALTPAAKPASRKISAAAPKVLIFAPHPDDECIIGGLALRLANEAKWRVINVAVTLGSKPPRRAPRLKELTNACAALGFGLIVPGGKGFERITPETRRTDRRHWSAAVKIVAAILAEQKPRAIFLPHAADGHPTHIGTHWLVMDALKRLPKKFRCDVVETEFWGQLAAPNLLVESSADDVVQLTSALACHVGEVWRNPYHARLPAWFMDNVRRGAESVGTRGGVAPAFAFGTLYRLSHWNGNELVAAAPRFLSAAQSPLVLFRGK